jgi:hypothetical protein
MTIEMREVSLLVGPHVYGPRDCTLGQLAKWIIEVRNQHDDEPSVAIVVQSQDLPDGRITLVSEKRVMP